jgi:glycosyltransferase involved in cell wall biosynthesis
MAVAGNGRYPNQKLMITVIIPAYNAAHTLPACLTALAQQTLTQPWETIVIDDGSTDQTSQIALNYGVKLIRHEQQRGAAAARNSGIQQAQGDIICCTDADCQPTPNWLENMLIPFADPEIIAAKGRYKTRQKELTARFVQLEYEDKYDLLLKESRIDFIDTYAAAYRREPLLKHGGFDERMTYLEDQELSFRLAAHGCAMVYQPHAVVYHRHSNTLAKYMRKKFLIGYWKAQVVRRFPERLVKDSHTPQVLKLQMVLAAGILAMIAAALLFPPAGFVAGLGLLVFALTTLPFMQKAWAKDTAVALTALFFLLARALALGVGYFWGVVRPLPNIQHISNIEQ